MSWHATDVTVPAGLCLLAVLDGVFAGFRAAAGRNARIHRARYHRRASLRGLFASLVVLTLVAAWTLAALALSSRRGELYSQLRGGGVRMLAVYGPYAVLVLIALAGYVLLPFNAANFMMVLILGPFTLARPWITIAGGVSAAWSSRNTVVQTAAILAVAGMLCIEPVLHRCFYDRPV